MEVRRFTVSYQFKVFLIITNPQPVLLSKQTGLVLAKGHLIHAFDILINSADGLENMLKIIGQTGRAIALKSHATQDFSEVCFIPTGS